jgi:hypothetical protein
VTEVTPTFDTAGQKASDERIQECV